MSVRVMSYVWEYGPKDKAELLLLLAIADFCNDDGECWPSVDTIAEKARMTDRGVQKVSARLVEVGWLEIDLRKGRHGCNLYRVKTPNPVRPEPRSPPNPVRQNPEPRSENPEPRSPKPSRTIKEPSESKRARAIIGAVLGEELTDAFLKHRRGLRKPLTTEHAAKLFVAELAKCRDPVAQTNQAILKGWQTVYPEKESTHGKSSRGQERVNAFIAGARGTP